MLGDEGEGGPSSFCIQVWPVGEFRISLGSKERGGERRKRGGREAGLTVRRTTGFLGNGRGDDIGIVR